MAFSKQSVKTEKYLPFFFKELLFREGDGENISLDSILSLKKYFEFHALVSCCFPSRKRCCVCSCLCLGKDIQEQVIFFLVQVFSFFNFQRVRSAVVNPISSYIAVVGECCLGEMKEKFSIFKCSIEMRPWQKKQNSLFVPETELAKSMTPAVRNYHCLHSESWLQFLLQQFIYQYNLSGLQMQKYQ